ncbi:PAS domain S-box protein [bacterium]|nr:PAS domain S-box protein [bacterium]
MKAKTKTAPAAESGNSSPFLDADSAYKTLFDTAVDAIFFMKDGRFIECNNRTLKLFRCRRDQIIGRTPYHLSPKKQPDGVDSREKALSLIKSASGGEPQFFEWRHTKIDGTPFDAEVSLNALSVNGEQYLQAIVRDITDRKKTEYELEQRLRFEILVTQLSASLINLPSSEVDREIEKALKKIVAFFGVGRSSIIQPTPDGKNFEFTHTCNADGVSPVPVAVNMAEQFPYTASQLLQGKVVRFTTLDDLPGEAAAIKAYYRLQGIKSSISVPMNVAGETIGALSISIFDKEKKWSEEIVKRLRLTGDILASAIMRRKAEDVLQKSEKRLREIIDASPDAITVTDLEGRITLCNQATCELHGFDSMDEIIGINVMDLISPEYRKQAVNNAQKTLAKGAVMDEEYMLVRKNGSLFPGELSARLHRDESGNPLEFIGITKDITERKKTELALQHEKQFLDGIIEGLPGDFFIIDDRGTIVRWNKNREKILGYAAEELSNLPAIANIVPEDRERIAGELARVFQGESIHTEYTVQTRSGERIPFFANGNCITVLGKKYVVGLALDITDRKKAETALQESEVKNRLLIENVPSVIWLTDQNGSTSFISPNVLSVYGYTPEEIYKGGADLFLNRIHPEDRDRVVRAFADLFSKKRDYEVEYRIQRKDGRWIWLQDRASTVRENNGQKQAYGVFSDITDRKEAELALVESEKRFRLLYETMPLGILYRSVSGEFLGLNQAGLDIFGADSGELSGFLDAISQTSFFREDGSVLDEKDMPFHQAVESGQPVQETVMGVKIPERKDLVWISIRAVPLVRPGEKKPYQVYTIFEDITKRKSMEEALKTTLSELEHLKTRLQEENVYLQEEIRHEYNFEEIIGQSRAIKQTLHDVGLAAQVNTTALIFGETGTGKELVARAIHNLSSRADRPLIKVNCAALPANLIESELFGHEKGAFTGASVLQKGRFELADGGTIFLDEIGELPLEVQAKLLRVLQESEFERIGGQETRQIDVRIIAATNRDLKKLTLEGRFRRDLYFRLNVLIINVPPLRERRDDVPLLTEYFVNKFGTKLGKSFEQISKKTMTLLQSLDWPGNIRELENMIERAVIFSNPPALQIDASTYDFLKADEPVFRLISMEEMERDHIVYVLENTGWTIEGNRGAAQILKINPSTLRSRMKKLGIVKPR